MKRFITVVCLLALVLTARLQAQTWAYSRLLVHSTVRIETVKPEGLCTGTGFMYEFPGPTTNYFVPVVVTCWHVVSNSYAGRFYISETSSNSEKTADSKLDLRFHGQQDCIRHPDTNIDLAIIPIAPALQHLLTSKIKSNLQLIPSELVANQGEMEGFGVFQELKFIGYPIGIWDEKNNLPIVRRGMTATDPAVDYNGKSQFLLDAAVFPGSSGSPVFVADDNAQFRGGALQLPKVKLLGVLSAVYQYNSEGKIEIVTIPTAFDAKVHTEIPANLGVVIKATQLKGFEDLLAPLLKRQAEMAAKVAEKK